MKHDTLRRCSAWLLTAVLAFSLIPPALAEEPQPGPEGGAEAKLEKVEILDNSETFGISIDPKGTKSLQAVLHFDQPDVPKDKWPEVQWSSSNPEVAVIAQDSSSPKNKAIVTGVGPGKTNIIASADGIKSEALVQEVSGLTLESDSIDLFVGEEKSIRYDRFGLAKNGELTWESSNVSVVEVRDAKLMAHFPGTAEISVRVGGYEAKCSVTVKEDVAEAVNGYLDSSRRCEFSSLLSTLNMRAREKTEQDLLYLTSISVPTKQGFCAYGYRSPASPGHGVGSSENYYYTPGNGQMGLSEISFIPNPGFSGTAVIQYIGYSANGRNFNGTIRIPVDKIEDVTGATAQEQPFTLRGDAFDAVCKAKTGMPVGYITFDQPAPNKGALYYDYDVSGEYAQKVDPGTRYYLASNPSLDRISFVPATGFTGMVELPYFCTDSAGNSFRGNMQITVSASNVSGSGEIVYSVRPGDSVLLDEDDFYWASRHVTGEPISSIRFSELPERGVGVLTYDRGGREETEVNTRTSYRYRSTPSIGRISFRPMEGFTGQCVIPYVATNSKGAQFSGIIRISVLENGGQLSGEYIRYLVSEDDTVDFASEDFDRYCRYKTGYPLSSVRFEQPSSRYGTLYEDYVDWNKRGSKVSSYTDYTINGRHSINDVTFEPTGRRDVVYVDFTGYNTKDERFTGTVEIDVGQAGSALIRYYAYGQPVHLNSQDFRAAARSAVNGTLKSIRFTEFPDPNAGTLYQKPGGGDVIPAQTNVIYAADSEAIEWLYFLPRAGYEGTVTIPYEGTDHRGRQFTGEVEITISSGYLAGSGFTDLAGWGWAEPSINYLKSMGITQGYRNGTFRPGKPINRGEFTLMLCRAFHFRSNGAPTGFKDVPAGSVYAEAVAAAREMGVVQGENGRFKPEAKITRQSAMTMICRALRAAGREPNPASTAVLVHFKDANKISPYARSSIATLVELGVVQGNAEKRLRPTSSISRAEMAVILHRALTL